MKELEKLCLQDEATFNKRYCELAATYKVSATTLYLQYLTQRQDNEKPHSTCVIYALQKTHEVEYGNR